MYNIRNIVEDLYYIGCSDRRLQLFESAYPVPDGISYNSYLLLDDKTVLFDTVDKTCSLNFFENLEAALSGRDLDYLVVHHMEPDHAASIGAFVEKYPDKKILAIDADPAVGLSVALGVDVKLTLDDIRLMLKEMFKSLRKEILY